MEPLALETEDGAATMAFAALLKRFRVKAHLSQQALADRALISVEAVSALERSYRKAPYRETVDRLADALALTPEGRVTFAEAARRARSARLTERDVVRAHNLPRQLTSFVGREDVVHEVVALVTSDPLVSLVGTGGAGKTRVAIEAGTRLLTHFPDGVWFVDLAPLSGPDSVTNALARALRIRERSRRLLLETLLAYLRRKRILVIFDNCEHVIDQARAVAGSLLGECPNASVMTTSREALAISGERVYWMPPLAVPPTAISCDDASNYGAVALFVDRAQAADRRFALNQENVDDVVAICSRLDGLPLAIELAAARSTVLAPWELSQRLDRAFQLLDADDRTTIPRHRTMRTVIDWSYGLLSSQARLLFDRLAAFTGGFTLESATALCADETLRRDDVLELLTSLVARSLVTVDFLLGSTRYHLLEATRQYALERLNERGERERFAQRHALACLVTAERLDTDWYDGGERAWFARAESELDNFRAALKWSLGDRHDVPSGQRLAASLARVWYSLSPVEGRRWIRLGVHLDDGIAAPVAVALNIADSELCGAFGEYKASLDAAERALLILGTSGDALHVARAKKAAGTALSALGRPAEGEPLLDEALATALRLDNRRLQALVLSDLGTSRSRRGDIATARIFYAEALARYVSLGLERPAASIAGHLAEVEFAAGDANAALQRAQEAYRGHEVTQNRRSIANDLSNMAAYLVALARYEDAREYALRALLAARDVGATVLTAYALQHVAAVEALRPCADDRRRERHKQAATLLGFVDARLTSLSAGREFTEKQEYQRVRNELSGAFGRELDDIMQLGAAWTEDFAAAVALDM